MDTWAGILAPTRTVLLVHPDAQTRLVLRNLLRAEGYHVAEAEHGAAASRALDGVSGIDLLVTELRLRDCNGVTLAQRLLSKNVGAKAIILSAECDGVVFLDPRLTPRIRFLGRGARTSTVLYAARELTAARNFRPGRETRSRECAARASGAEITLPC